MQGVEPRIREFQREFLDELHIAEAQLLALAEAVPAEEYGWKPAEDARSFSAVLVHIAAGNLLLLDRAGVPAPAVIEFYGHSEGDPVARAVTVVRKNLDLENTVTTKANAIDLVKRSFIAVEESFAAATDEMLAVRGPFFGEPTTVRRVYLRMLAHSHEHMGQAIAYVRTMGLKAPWPDPLKAIESVEAKP